MALALCCAAIAGPALLPISKPPLVSLYTEATALLAWGLMLAWLAARAPYPADHWAGIRRQPLVAGLAVLCMALMGAAASVAWLGLPLAIGLRHGAVLAAAVIALLAGARLVGILGTPIGAALVPALLIAFLLAGLGSAAIAVLQYLGIDGPWEPLGKDGRAGANLAQPNLLGTQLLWATAAGVALVERGRLPRWLARAGAVLLLAGLAASASRSAAVAALALALWGGLDRRLGRESRWMLMAAPFVLALAWFALALWHDLGGPGFAGTGLLQKADPTSSRWRVWQQCARLVAEHPWFGVGWGQFNFGWTLTPMPNLPRTAGYTFGHSHNIVVQWAVELGLPLALAMTGLIAWLLWRCVRELWRADVAVPIIQRAALAMVLTVLVHSQFEFPLWHTNFLLPTAFLLGLAAARPSRAPLASAKPAPNAAVAPLLMALAAAFALLDYRAIADVWSPPPEAAPLEQRIALARKSWLFGHFADRFDGTLATDGERSMAPYRRAVFEILDWRMLGSWAQAHAEGGQLDKARFLAARLREFDSPAAQGFFAVCATEPGRFQCSDSQKIYRLDDFR